MKVGSSGLSANPQSDAAGSRAVSADELRAVGQEFGAKIDQLSSFVLKRSSKQRIVETVVIEPQRRMRLPLTDRSAGQEQAPPPFDPPPALVDPVALRGPFMNENPVPAGKTAGAFLTSIGGQSQG